MDITPLIRKDQCYITSYTASGFRINKEMVEGSLILTAAKYQSWDVKKAQDLNIKTFDFVDRNHVPEIILLGTGQDFVPLPLELMRVLNQENICPEVMDTAAACRTYNVLLSEGRNVLAMLIAAT